MSNNLEHFINSFFFFLYIFFFLLFLCAFAVHPKKNTPPNLNQNPTNPYMNNSTLNCKSDRRRKAVRTSTNLAGLDYLEISDNQRTLTVYFLGKAPTTILKENVRIEGGRRITDIRVTDIEIYRDEDPELDDYMQVFVDKPGDFSPYLLRVVELDCYGQPTTQPMQGFDPRYAHLQFNFKVNCPSDLDCKQNTICPPEKRLEPENNYLAKDYTSFRQLIFDRLALTVPDWKERHVPDLGVTLVELLAYAGDHLSYYQDAVATEAYLGTARQRISVRRHARLVDYQMHEGCNARASVCVETDSNLTLDTEDTYFITGSNNILLTDELVLQSSDLDNIPAHTYEVFEPMVTGKIQLYKAHNKIPFYTWGNTECCLPKGATTATLQDTWNEQNTCSLKPSAPQRLLNLHIDDILIFEEVLGAKTGNGVDADPNHRHVVRLTKVSKGIDHLYNQPIVDITWADVDALPFSLCISAIGQPSECKLLENISVARGNVILVDHGQTIRDEDLGKVPERPAPIQCEGENLPLDGRVLPGRFSPKLKKIPLTFRQSLPPKASASRLFLQNPHQALPQIHLKDSQPQQWMPQLDLLKSNSQDLHFVVEIDNDRRSHLRFGNGELGMIPTAARQFQATYRVGNGISGNMGAESITHIVLRNTTVSGAIRKVRNPLPAQGGIDPEPITEVKLFAPQTFRKTLQRAITPDDYVKLAENYTDEQGRRVQRAAASLQWMGNWYALVVAVDPLGKKQADEDFLQAIANYLCRYRRIGHDLEVVAARYVPLDIEMNICVLPHYLRGHVKAELIDRFSDRRLPDGSLGFFHPDNLSFGDSITLSKLVVTALGIAGVESVTVTKLQRLNEEPNGELANGILPLKMQEIAQVDNDPNFPENGKLTLNARGGR